MPTSIRLTPEVEQRLDNLAVQTGRTKTFYLREIIERGLEDMEDYYLAANVLERVKKGDEKTFRLNEVEDSLGLAD
jgi:RHH-type transcriptional regulator, rel operon repressor / antitoxin RelB